MGHAYAIIDLFVMKQTVKHSKRTYDEEYRMVIMKDPLGPRSEMDHDGWWSTKQVKRWTDTFKSQVPLGIDPLDYAFQFETGIFIIEIGELSDYCFNTIEHAIDLSDDGYSNSWYDMDDDSIKGDEHQFKIIIPQTGNGDIYINVETYY